MSKFLFFTDSHFSAHFTEFSKPDKDFINNRFRIQCNTLIKLLELAKDKSLPVIFGGDMFDIRNQIDIEDFNHIYSIFSNYPEVKCYLLRGNHDSVNNLMGSPSSIDMFKCLPNKNVISNPEHIVIDHVDFYFMPYGENISEIKSKLKEFAESARENDNSVLVAHLGVNGAKMNGIISKSELMSNDFYPDIFNMVYLGHYHARQVFDKNHKNMFYGGSLFQNSFSDSGSHKGYDLVDINSGTFKDSFVKTNNPEFYTVFNWDEQAKKLVDQGNYVRLQTNDSKDVKQAQDNSNVRTELQKTFKINSRLDIKSNDSPLIITKKYLDKNKIDAFKEAKELLSS